MRSLGCDFPLSGRGMTSSSHRVQGLNNDEVAADWPPISAADIAWLRQHYPQLDERSQPHWHSPRPLSAAEEGLEDGETDTLPERS